MKKIAALFSALTLLSNVTAFPISAETAVPVDVSEDAYAALLASYGCDADKDGVVTEEEFRSITYLRMNPCGFEDLSWIAGMESLNSLTFEDGTLSNSAAQSLLQVPQIRTLLMYGVSLDSISFIADMELTHCTMQECTPFSDSELLSVMRVEDVTVKKGFAVSGGVYPEGLFKTNDIMLTIADTSIACLDKYGTVQSQSTSSIFYGKEVGETTFSLSIYGIKEFTGKITVEDFEVEPTPLHDPPLEAPQIVDTIHYGASIGTALLKDDTLYSLDDGKLQIEAENVIAVDDDYVFDQTGKSTHCTALLFNDGTISADGKKVKTDKKFVQVKNGCFITGDGEAYALRKENDEYYADLLHSEYGGQWSGVASCFYSKSGEVVFMAYMEQEDGSYRWKGFPMGIKDIISAQANYFVDEGNILWQVKREKGKEPQALKIAENVVGVGVYDYKEYPVASVLYIGTDGKAYLPETGKEVTIVDGTVDPNYAMHYLDARNFTVWYTEDGKMMSDPSVGHDYHLSMDNVLTIDCRGKKSGLTDVECFVVNDYSEYGKVLYAYFLRKDGSLWCYSSEQEGYFEIPFEISEQPEQPKPIAGDVNLDGKAGVADAVLLQKYLLCKEVLTAEQTANAQLCDDGSINGFDLAALKRRILAK